MEENTQIFSKPSVPPKEEPHGGSQFFNISVRGWLAVGLIFTVCMHSAAAILLAVLLKQPELLKVTEPLYTMSGMALAYYFGQQTKPVTPTSK